MNPSETIQKVAATPPGQDVQALDNLVMFRVDKHRFRYGQSYALLRGDQMILVDAVHEATRAAVDRWRERYTPVALFLTHSDLLSQAFGPLSKVAQWVSAPVLIHSADRRGQAVQPVEEAEELLAQHQLRYFPVPGHTPGSSLLYAEPEQFLFTGDATIGANYEKEETDFTHAPIRPADWDNFAAGWNAVTVPVRGLFPLHGKPAFALENLNSFKQQLLVPENEMRE